MFGQILYLKQVSFRLVKVHSSTYQLVQGPLLEIKADMESKSGEIETCDISLWEQPWIETDKAVEIKFKCTNLGEKTVYSKYVM